jgi:modulator of FtsH protease
MNRMTADIISGWDNFFVAEAGASAALAGLLFVAVSINLTRILQFPQLPTRAAETLVSLISVLVVSTFALVPGQSMAAYGMEIGGTGFVFWTLQSLALSRTYPADRQYSNFVLRVLMNQVPPLPFMVAGGLLIAGRTQSIYWIVPGVLLSFAAGIFGAWVLLIEIQR